MFPESFAQKWIARFSKPGDVVLDPFCGRGTTPFCAIEMGRRAFGVDINDVAYCLSKAKTSAPSLPSLLRRLTYLERNFDGRNWRQLAEQLPEFFYHAFARRTLQQIMYLRELLRWRDCKTDAMVAALALGSLHGEATQSPSYFSNQMPRTISTKPAYSVRFWKDRDLQPPNRNIFTVLRQRALYRYETPPPQGDSIILHEDMRRLPLKHDRSFGQIKCVVTSPPYLDTTNFEEDQWLRLWFLGGPPYPTRGRVSRDDRHVDSGKYWQFIGDMWRSLGQIVASGAHVVIRIGSRKISADNITRALAGAAVCSGRRVKLLSADVSEIQKRQTDVFRPGTTGCKIEIDCVFRFA